MATPRKERPYDKADEYEAAIKKAGSIGKFAVEHGVSENTARKWCDEVGASTQSGIAAGQYARDAVAIIDRMNDEELSTIVGLLGNDRSCIVLNISKNTLRLHLQRRGVIPRAGDHSPKASMLSQRVRRLESDDAAIRELARAIEASATLTPAPAPVKRKAASVAVSKRARVDVVLHVSDKQFGEVVHPEEIPGGNYNPDVYAQERLPRYVDAVEGILRTVAAANPIGTVWIAQGGDFVEGENVFKGQHWHLAMDAGRQVDVVAQHWAGAVAELATEAKSLGAQRVACVSVVGNHGVQGGRSAGATPPSLSYDWLAYRSAALRLQGMPDNGGVDWFDEEAHRAVYFEAAGHVVLMTHGDQDRGGGLIGVPVVTGMRNDLTVRLQTGIDHRYHMVGHYHRRTSITTGGTRMKLWGGDWCGPNSLSLGRGGGGHPSQMVYTFHPDHGLHSSWIVNLADLDHDINHEVIRAPGSPRSRGG